jgi:hypothetical protein
MSYPRDYSQNGDPYGIHHEYTVQSACGDDCDAVRAIPSGVDVRGNTCVAPRPVPTQDEANFIKRSIR